MQKKRPRGRNDGHVFDHSKITENIYIGSDLCQGKICPVHSEEFKKLGVCVELNLSAEKKEIPPDDIDIYAWLPVVDGYAPGEDQLVLGTAIINVAVNNGNIVYVHCKNGHGRSPTMLAAYFIRYKGMGVDEAIELLKSKRPEVHIEDLQKKALDKFASK